MTERSCGAALINNVMKKDLVICVINHFFVLKSIYSGHFSYFNCIWWFSTFHIAVTMTALCILQCIFYLCCRLCLTAQCLNTLMSTRNLRHFWVDQNFSVNYLLSKLFRLYSKLLIVAVCRVVNCNVAVTTILFGPFYNKYSQFQYFFTYFAMV